MKILGLSCGRKMGNSEIAVKEALMGAEEAGAQVEIIRLMDLSIKPCRGCENCTAKMSKGEKPECVIKDDDMPFFLEKWRQANGMILGAPVYFLSAPGYLKVLNDRMISSELTFTIEASMKGEKKRPIGLISIGGGDWDWVPMGLSMMKLLTFTEFKVIDQLQVRHAARPGQILLDKQAINSARKLGKRVAEATAKEPGEMKFLGDDPGICPVCNSNILVTGKMGSPVECPICGVRGSLKIDGDKISMTINEGDLNQIRTTVPGRLKHFTEIKDAHEKFYQNLETVQKEIGKYESYLTCVKPPSRSKK